MIDLECGSRVTVKQPSARFHVGQPDTTVRVKNPAPSIVKVTPSPAPRFEVSAPRSRVSVLPVSGPEGPDGPPGPAGPAGPAGPPGAGGVFTSYTFAVPDVMWRIEHNLGTFGILVETFDINGDEVEANIRFPNENVVEIDWYYPTAGSARLFA